MSTRKLLIAALLCGVAILLAGTFLLLSLPDDVKTRVDQAPPPPTSTTRA